MTKLKKKAILFFIFLSSMSLFSSVQAAPHGYVLGINAGDNYYWTANTVNETALIVIYGSDWESDLFFSGLEEGAKLRLNISSINNDYMHLSLYPGMVYMINIWDWSSTNTWENIQFSGGYYYLKDFDDYVSNIYHGTAVPLVILTPSEAFLGGYSDILIPANYEVIGNKIIAEFHPGDGFVIDPDADVYYFAEYNTQGVLSVLEMYNEFNQLVLGMTLDSNDSSIPGFNLLIVLGTTSLLLIGTIIIIRKRIKI